MINKIPFDIVLCEICALDFDADTTTTTTIYRPLFQDNLGKPVPER